MFNSIQLQQLLDIVSNAGKIILENYNQANFNVEYKLDNSPVTKADYLANEYICYNLNLLFPEIAIISEENDNSLVTVKEYFWLLDPLDGTSSFIDRSDFFTVNLALIKNNQPIFGLVHVPLTGDNYYTLDNKAYRNKQTIQTRIVPKEGMTVLISKHSPNYPKMNNFLANFLINQVINTSSTLKICKIAEGSADLYPRFAGSMQWDTAAGDAILKAAGGIITDLNGDNLKYGDFGNNFYNPDFIAYGYKNIISEI